MTSERRKTPQKKFNAECLYVKVVHGKRLSGNSDLCLYLRFHGNTYVSVIILLYYY